MIKRKHFKAIAEILQNEYDFTQVKGHCFNCRYRVKHIIKELADYFAQNNSQFDRERFMKACGL